jgi:predicted small metal-binding protein
MEEPHVKTFACGDVVPGCTAHFTAADEAAVLGLVAAHAAADHGLTSVSPELVHAVRGAMVSV